MKFFISILFVVIFLISAGCVNGGQNSVLTPTPQIIYVTVLVTHPPVSPLALSSTSPNGLVITDVKFTPGNEIKDFAGEMTGKYFQSWLSFTVTNKGSSTHSCCVFYRARMYDKNGNFYAKSDNNAFTPSLEPGESTPVQVPFGSFTLENYAIVPIGKIEILESDPMYKTTECVVNTYYY